MIQTRLQKERDTFHEECEKLQERLELQQSQLTKAQRDRENMHTEMEVFRDRWEKAQQNQQKLQVGFGPFCHPSLLREEILSSDGWWVIL